MFYKTHRYLIDHMKPSVNRLLVSEIDWNDRLIGIKGSRGVGKTNFLLQYAKEFFGRSRECLYINLNHLCFTDISLFDFAKKFADDGGKTLLIDQVFKYTEWSTELKECYEKLPTLKIIFTGSSVMRLKEENPQLANIVKSYNLRGFSFREYLNLMTEEEFEPIKLDNILTNYKSIANDISSRVDIEAHFKMYLHHGFYPFFLEKRNFSENLIKTMNMMMEVDILLIKQIEPAYLSKIRKLLYLLVKDAPCAPNVSQLSQEIKTSRATVMNYVKYLADARLINILYKQGETYPKKPTKIYMHNTNLMFAIGPENTNEKDIRETFFFNTLNRDHKVNSGERGCNFLINNEYNFKIEKEAPKSTRSDVFYAVDCINSKKRNVIPLWLFGFLY